MCEKDLFILAGNGEYDNRGCEAIIRGTVEIIRQSFNASRFLAISHFQNNSQFKDQVSKEYEASIIHKKTMLARKRFTPYWFFQKALMEFCPYFWGRLVYKDMSFYLKQARAVFSVGGDNYSLDYGRPVLFTVLDDLVLDYRKPLIIWGASVGPFDKIPKYEKYMIEHLKKVTGIFVRETASMEYLARKGVKDNTYLMADPAFLLKPVRPMLDQEIEEGAIGINLSPLMTRYITGGDYKKWVILASQIIREVSSITDRKIYLIPHVTSPHSNDHAFLKDILSLLSGMNIVLISDNYNAGETKWIISKMAVFAGARTHSTIAAISSYVPTLSFVYSIKAVGINRDIFGHDRFCIYLEECKAAIVAEKIKYLIGESERIKEELSKAVPVAVDLASAAGAKSKEIIYAQSFL
jgi:polysaccharide pyruvyl transferase WcaK-like protein